ncbi:GNAT family N-acetyltransferase [Alloiococcus sp. CFN-8]|uniref:GNAT family N-acetyltransferase n=1 Tax=Alloiococcus sp. CFN-8 TaxID=3416081 RepID=UPI003CEBE95C
MIIEIESLNDYWDFIDEVSGDPNFSDPHYIYNKNNLLDACHRSDEKVFAVFKENKAIGLFVFLILMNEKYIEMIIGLSKSSIAYSEMLNYLEEEYKEFQMDFVFNPKNYILRQILNEKKARIDTEQIKLNLVKDDILYEMNVNIQEYTPQYEHKYLVLHTKDTYWTGEKVLKATNMFRVLLAIKNDEVIGYLDITYSFDENEPYDLYVKKEYQWSGYERALLAEAVRLNRPHGMMTLIDVDDVERVELFKSMGFVQMENQNSVYATYKSSLQR